jgi:hypothetical protein
MIGAIVLAAALASASPAPPAPHVDLPAPWQATVSLPVSADFTYVAQWVLPNGLPDPPAIALQYVSMQKRPLDEGGLGGYLADTVANLNGSPDVTNVKYSQIVSCVRPAWMVTFNATVSDSPRAFEEVYMTYRSTLYLAEYNRPADQAVVPAAHTALLAFCTSVPSHRSSNS